jgi:hypothetical protein
VEHLLFDQEAPASSFEDDSNNHGPARPHRHSEEYHQSNRKDHGRLHRLGDLSQAESSRQTLDLSRSPLTAREAGLEQAPATTGSSADYGRPLDSEEQRESFGTLMLSKGGRSKYLGPTAGSEWLKESETQEVLDTPNMTRAPSPAADRTNYGQFENPVPNGLTSFPFNCSGVYISTRELLTSLPPRDEAWRLAECYYRYCAWQ